VPLPSWSKKIWSIKLQLYQIEKRANSMELVARSKKIKKLVHHLALKVGLSSVEYKA
jgi:hypothetical protein